jgi:hypothetical protein
MTKNTTTTIIMRRRKIMIRNIIINKVIVNNIKHKTNMTEKIVTIINIIINIKKTIILTRR